MNKKFKIKLTILLCTIYNVLRGEEMKKANLMVVGTSSGAGKSLFVTALCRIFYKDKYKVSPFKSQNMALNSYITKDGKEMDIRETERVIYTLSNIFDDGWVLADEENCPELGGVATFGFDEAVKYLKRGFKVKRKGWNGKDQYIELATNVSFKTPNDEVINVDHADMGNKAVAFHGTSGIQLGWLVSQSALRAAPE